ncbi:MAG: nuclear transport factor 2 family protein [Kordiimonadaceae bacterium]|nr:nuclear transport factor 2 family protein [Kordiimonadaceae bacterium]
MNVIKNLAVALAFVAAGSSAELVAEPTAEQVVQEQLDAYNDADLDRFVAAFTEDVVVARYPDEVRYTGHDDLRRAYSGLFLRNPNHEVYIKSRTVQGNKVIDVELYSETGKREDIIPDFFYLAIYTVENGKVSRMEFVTPEASGYSCTKPTCKQYHY